MSRKSLQRFRTLQCLSHYTLEEMKQSAVCVHGTYLPLQYTHTQHFWQNFQETCCPAWNLVILPFYYFPPSYHLPWYAGWFDCMDLTSWQIWNFSVCRVFACLQHFYSQCTCLQFCWALNGEETWQTPRYIQPEISWWLDIFPYIEICWKGTLQSDINFCVLFLWNV